MLILEFISRAVLHGVRGIARRPLSFATSSLCLAIGIAACAMSWTMLDAAIFRPYGLADANRLVVVWEADPSRDRDLIEVSHLNFLDWQRQSQSLESMAALGSSHWPTLARIGSETVPVAARAVSRTFFDTLGTVPAIGRDFASSDLEPGTVPPVILSHRMWQSEFGGNREVVGRALFMDGAEHQIIGVMPRGFGYPDDPDAWISVERALSKPFENLPLDQQRKIGVLEVLGRKRPNISNDEVRAELNGIIGGLQRLHDPAAQGATIAVVNRYTDVLLGRLGPRLWIALAMALIVLLFACANVAAVRMSQFRERAAELSARLFLGSSRSRLVTDLAVEAMPLVAAAVVAAWVMSDVLVALISGASIVAESGVALDEHRGIGAAVVFAMLTGFGWLVVGVLPAWRASRLNITGVGAQTSPWRVVHRTTTVGAPLVFGQALAAIVVVAVAGAGWQAFDRLARTDVGFATSGVMLVDVALPDWLFKSPADRRSLTDRLQNSLKELPGVTHVAAVSLRPFRFGAVVDGLPIRRTGDSLISPSDATGGSRVVITPDYFAALGQPIIAGRSFNDFDRSDSERVVIISPTLARALWGNENAVGQRLEIFTLGDKWQPRLVVGIAGDARYRGLDRPSLELYVPAAQATTE